MLIRRRVHRSSRCPDQRSCQIPSCRTPERHPLNTRLTTNTHTIIHHENTNIAKKKTNPLRVYHWTIALHNIIVVIIITITHSTQHFYPFAIETAGRWHEMAIELTQETGRRITTITEDTRETTFLFQRLSMALQRGNAVSFHSTMVTE